MASRFNKLVLGAGLSCFGILLSLMLVEVGFRVFSKLSPGPKPWSDRPKYYFKAEASETIQDFPHSKEKAAGTFRIAVVGDSYTFAPFMQFTDAFPKKLEQMLNLNQSELRAEVVNYGVPAYSSAHELPVVKRALEEGADLVILQITLNDPELKGANVTGIDLSRPDRWGSYQPTGFMADVLRHWKSLHFVLSRLHNSQTHRRYIDYFKGLFSHPKGWKMFRGSIDQMAAACRTSEKPIVAFVFPLFGLAMDDRYPLWEIHQKVDTALTEIGIPHQDLSEIYRGIPLERLQVLPGVDRHPNEIAHRMAAEAMYDWLVAQNLIPPELRIKQRFKSRTSINKDPVYQDSGA
jgi:hypothetical protein